jgi:hypothetical protein
MSALRLKAPAATRLSLMVSLLLMAGNAHALEQASGVNLTADEGFGARHHGMALTRASFGQGADAVINAPASMNDVHDFTFTTAHAEQFGVARFDNAAVLIPWHNRGTLGFGIARYAVSDVERRVETTGQPTAEPDGLFTTSDWMITGSFARRFGSAAHAFDVAGSAHLLRRQLDQGGLGMRGDAMAQYTNDGRLRAGTFVRGLVPSMARWESGYTEYEAPEAVLFVALRKDIPYFYGTLETGFETPGILQPGARSSSSLEGERGVTDPVSVLRTSKIGAEFNFNFGLSLRGGFDEIAPSAWSSSARLGIGYNWRNILAFDYAFATHPYLDESHRVALRFTPSFPKFEGRNFRPNTVSSVTVPREKLRPTYPPPRQPGTPAPAPAPVPPKQIETQKNAPPPPPPEEFEEELEEGEILERQ